MSIDAMFHFTVNGASAFFRAMANCAGEVKRAGYVSRILPETNRASIVPSGEVGGN
jgi:hypothetical protein